ncbi:zinc-binding alcohol dehydrogenase family protein [Paenibacillus sp. TY11]|uniref:zinc-binding alcohol dehydrogenase family protein n=1 Tax=Paenibacillus sp. TY11 TaxID=3448633 RepID=UPI00403A01C6
MSNQKMMRAIGYYEPGEGVPPFQEVEVERPKASGRDLLVAVKAVSVNPSDWRSHKDKKPDDSSLTIAGRDVAGVVVEAGPDCNIFKVGDEVYYSGSIIRPGGFSEFHLVDERIVGKKPKSLDFAQAAALPLTTITAWEAYYERLGISKNPSDNEGKSILIIGAAGGVGSIATQLAKLAGLTVIATASRPESIKWTKEHGADHVIDHHRPLEPQLKELGLVGVPYIFVLNNPDQHLNEMKKVILPQGKICSILPFEQPAELGELFIKSVTFAWELMYTRSAFQTDDMIEQHRLLNEVSNLVDAGKVRTTMKELIKPINSENLKEAFHKSLSGSTIGKIVLEGFE